MLNIDHVDFGPILPGNLSDWKTITAQLKPEFIKHNGLIYAQNGENFEVCLVKEGYAVASFVMANGSERINGFVTSGSMFGYRSCLDSQPYNASLRAYTDMMIYRIPAKLFRDTISSDRKFENRINQYLSEVGNSMLKRAKFLALPGNNSKVAALLLLIARQIGKEGKTGTMIPLKLTHDIIAKLIYSDRVTVSRIMSQLEKDGLVVKEFGFYVICSGKDLKTYLESCLM